jgi:hypothetical protein
MESDKNVHKGFFFSYGLTQLVLFLLTSGSIWISISNISAHSKHWTTVGILQSFSLPFFPFFSNNSNP